MFKKLTCIFLFCLTFLGSAFAQAPSMSEIQRQQEILQKEQELTTKIKEGEKVFVKKINVKGVTLLTEERIKEIIAPFQKKWLENKEIQQILELIKQAYIQETKQTPVITCQIKKQQLEIQVDELRDCFYLCV